MKEIKITLVPEWRLSPSKIHYLQILYMGTVAVAQYRKFFSDGGVASYIASCPIHTIETDLGIFTLEEDARVACIKAAKLFVQQLQKTTP
jgi:hypothetical protein